MIPASITIIVIWLILRALLNGADNVSRTAESDYGESTSIHEHAKKMGRVIVRDTVGEGSEDKTDAALEDAKTLGKKAVIATGKGLGTSLKAAKYGLKTAHQLYFNTDEAVEKLKQDIETTKNKIEEKYPPQSPLSKPSQAGLQAKKSTLKLAAPSNNPLDQNNYITLEYFCNVKGLEKEKAIKMIRDGFYQGRLFNGEWMVHSSEVNS